jgi:hypothetical protein
MCGGVQTVKKSASIRNYPAIISVWSLAMKRMNLRKTLSAAALIGATIVTTTALAQPSQGGYGMGGMMDGYDFGWMGGYGGI